MITGILKYIFIEDGSTKLEYYPVSVIEPGRNFPHLIKVFINYCRYITCSLSDLCGPAIMMSNEDDIIISSVPFGCYNDL